jgi:hypothetical protein
MKTFQHSSSNYINYLDHTSSSKISIPEDSSSKDNLSNVIKNHFLLYENIVQEEIIDLTEKNDKQQDTSINNK